MLSFKRQVGAAADLCELEYCIALMQTSKNIRKKPIISSLDILRLLQSKHGLEISHAQAIQVVRRLAGQSAQEFETTGVVEQTFSTEMRHATARLGIPQTQRVPKSVSQGSALTNRKKKSAPQPQQGSQLFVSASRASSLTPMVVRSADDSVEEHQDADATFTERGGLPEEYLDLIQMLSTLLMPLFARMAGEFYNGPPRELLDKDIIPYIVDVDVVPSWFDRNIRKPIDDMMQNAKERDRVARQSLRPDPGEDLAELVCQLFAEVAGPPLDGIVDVDAPHYAYTSHNYAPPRITKEFVRDLLFKFGEEERAQDDVLIAEMLREAYTTTGRMDKEALLNGVSSDLLDWNVGSEDGLSTFFEDVFATSDPSQVTCSLLGDDALEQGLYSTTPRTSRDEETATVESPPPLEQHPESPSSAVDIDLRDNNQQSSSSMEFIRQLVHWTWGLITIGWCFCYCSENRSRGSSRFRVEPANIDMVMDAHSSVVVIVFIWIYLICSFTIYVHLLIRLPPMDCGEELSEFGCRFAQTILSWAALAIMLSLQGVLTVVPLSIGNNPFRQNKAVKLLGIAVSLVYAIIPYMLFERYRVSRYGHRLDSIESAAFRIAQCITLACGCGVSLLLVWELLLSWLRTYSESPSEATKQLLYYLTTSNERAETRLKMAATRKVNRLMRNAYELHYNPVATVSMSASSNDKTPSFQNPVGGRLDTAVRNFFEYGAGNEEECGGLFWTWQNILSGSMFDVEGVWINTRLVVTQGAQVLVGVFILGILFLSIGWSAQQVEEARRQLDPGLPQWQVNIIPTPYMVAASLYPAWAISVGVVVLVILMYIPSTAKITLQFRSELTYQSMRSPNFQELRSAMDTVYLNSANAVFGMVGAAGLFFVLFGAVTFIFLWPPTRDHAFNFLAWCLGLTVTIVLKMVLTGCCRGAQYRAYYRIRPQAASLTSVALECWYIGVAGTVLISRIGQFLLAAAFWVGRIDSEFLSTDVNLLGYRFDYTPMHFKKDILAHEAHRHPFIERIAQMYLMVLRHERFGSRAGAAWRKLFVLAVFPWLRRHRVSNEERVIQARVSLAQSMQDNRKQRDRKSEKLEEKLAGDALEGATKVYSVSKDVASRVGGMATNLAKTTGLSMRQIQSLMYQMDDARDEQYEA